MNFYIVTLFLSFSNEIDLAITGDEKDFVKLMGNFFRMDSNEFAFLQHEKNSNYLSQRSRDMKIYFAMKTEKSQGEICSAESIRDYLKNSGISVAGASFDISTIGQDNDRLLEKIEAIICGAPQNKKYCENFLIGNLDIKLFKVIFDQTHFYEILVNGLPFFDWFSLVRPEIDFS
jgi:hypothetical protein